MEQHQEGATSTGIRARTTEPNSEVSGIEAQFSTHFIYRTSGISCLVVGFALMLAGESRWYAGAGGVLTTLGGILLSMYVSGVNSKVQAVSILKGELLGIGRQLGRSAGQIFGAVRQVHLGELSAEEAIERIPVAADGVDGALQEIELLTGVPIEIRPAAEVVRTAMSALEDVLYRSTDSSEPSTGQTAGVLPDEKVQELSKKLTDLEAFVRPSVPREAVQAQCPYCQTIQGASVGTASGSSSTHLCGKCLQRFHVHRTVDGSILVKQWGGGPEVPRKTHVIKCPKCAATFNLSVEDRPGRVSRACFTCNTLLTIDAAAGTVVNSASATVAGGTPGADGKTLVCPKCLTPRRVSFSDATSIRSYCGKCEQILQHSSPAQDGQAAIDPPRASP